MTHLAWVWEATWALRAGLMACSRSGQSCRERAERLYRKNSLKRARSEGGSCDSAMKVFRLQPQSSSFTQAQLAQHYGRVSCGHVLGVTECNANESQTGQLFMHMGMASRRHFACHVQFSLSPTMYAVTWSPHSMSC